jgi:hypothetical protein
MAEKKRIKGIKDNAGSGDSTSAIITVGDVNPPRNSGGTTTAPAPDIMFEQVGHKALCFNVDDIINTESIVIGGATIITGARRIVRGTVLATANNNSGTIEENKSNKVINFRQPYLKELGITVGSEVRYDLVPNLISGGEIAVNVELQP